MTITDTDQASAEYVGTKLQTQLYETLDRFETCPPDGDIVSAIESLELKYDHWQSKDSFISNGVHILRVGEHTPTHTIPAELGYEASDDVFEINFMPMYFAVSQSNQRVIVDKLSINTPQEDQKHMSMIQALEGCLDYITLVEAGLLPKPSYILGFTNATMAKVTERVGLKTAASVAREISRERNFETNEDSVQAEYEKISFIEARITVGNLEAGEAEECITEVLKTAGFAWKIGDKDLHKHALYLANRLMVNDPEMRGAVAVWGNYEDFKDGVIAYKRKFGDRILKLAERELDTLVSKVSTSPA